MSETDINFLSVVVQIIPVLLLTVVIEARQFQYRRNDAVPAVKAARLDLRKSMSPLIYWLWRARSAYRRSGFSTITSLAVAGILAALELVGLVLLANGTPPGERLKNIVIGAIALTIFLLAVKPVFEKLIQQSSQLAELERDVQLAHEEKSTSPARASNVRSTSKMKLNRSTKENI